jgi:hypothetical protein
MKNAKNLLFAATFFVASVFGNQAEAACTYEQLVEGENLQIGTMLTWATNFEENNAMFVIEKSEDGVDFMNIGSVEGGGDSENMKEYNFLDVMASSEMTFYRLKQVDFDGSFSYSEITTIRQKFKNNFMVARMTNVATKDLFEVTIDAFKQGEMTYELANWKQESVLKDKLLVVNGLNEVAVDLIDQKEGIYKLNLSMDGEEETLVIKKVADEIKSKANVASKAKLDKGKN